MPEEHTQTTVEADGVRRRTVLKAVGAGAAVSVTGCLHGDDGDDLEAAEFSGEAQDYLLSTDQLPGEWMDQGTRTPEAEYRGLSSSEVRDLQSETGEEASLAVAVFDTAADAGRYIQSQREPYGEAEAWDEVLGDESFSFSYAGTEGVEARRSNVAVQAIAADVETALDLAEAQLNSL